MKYFYSHYLTCPLKKKKTWWGSQQSCSFLLPQSWWDRRELRAACLGSSLLTETWFYFSLGQLGCPGKTQWAEEMSLEGGRAQGLGTVIRTPWTRALVQGWGCLSVPYASRWAHINPKALWDPYHDDRKEVAQSPPGSRWPQPLEKQHRGSWLCSGWSCTLLLWTFCKRFHNFCLPWFYILSLHLRVISLYCKCKRGKGKSATLSPPKVIRPVSLSAFPVVQHVCMSATAI